MSAQTIPQLKNEIEECDRQIQSALLQMQGARRRLAQDEACLRSWSQIKNQLGDKFTALVAQLREMQPPCPATDCGTTADEHSAVCMAAPEMSKSVQPGAREGVW